MLHCTSLIYTAWTGCVKSCIEWAWVPLYW